VELGAKDSGVGRTEGSLPAANLAVRRQARATLGQVELLVSGLDALGGGFEAGLELLPLILEIGPAQEVEHG
jgi:hypothetical protein